MVDVNMPKYADKYYTNSNNEPIQVNRTSHTRICYQSKAHNFNMNISRNKSLYSPNREQCNYKKLWDIFLNAHIIYSTIMVLQKQLASEQSKSTENTNKAAQRLLDYLSKHPKIIIRYHVSQINRPVHSGTLHPLVPK